MDKKVTLVTFSSLKMEIWLKKEDSCPCLLNNLMSCMEKSCRIMLLYNSTSTTLNFSLSRQGKFLKCGVHNENLGFFTQSARLS